jgi:hypothetical protein
MKCQQCTKAATAHITELVNGAPVEYHVCEDHLAVLETLPGQPPRRPLPEVADSLCRAWANPVARQKMAAHLLPALCLALLNEQVEVRILACFWLTELRLDANSALGALRTALSDSDERVRKAAEFAIATIESGEAR